jgi:hypothetical protein
MKEGKTEIMGDRKNERRKRQKMEAVTITKNNYGDRS